MSQKIFVLTSSWPEFKPPDNPNVTEQFNRIISKLAYEPLLNGVIFLSQELASPMPAGVDAAQVWNACVRHMEGNAAFLSLYGVGTDRPPTNKKTANRLWNLTSATRRAENTILRDMGMSRTGWGGDPKPVTRGTASVISNYPAYAEQIAPWVTAMHQNGFNLTYGEKETEAFKRVIAGLRTALQDPLAGAALGQYRGALAGSRYQPAIISLLCYQVYLLNCVTAYTTLAKKDPATFNPREIPVSMREAIRNPSAVGIAREGQHIMLNGYLSAIVARAATNMAAEERKTAGQELVGALFLPPEWIGYMILTQTRQVTVDCRFMWPLADYFDLECVPGITLCSLQRRREDWPHAMLPPPLPVSCKELQLIAVRLQHLYVSRKSRGRPARRADQIKILKIRDVRRDTKESRTAAVRLRAEEVTELIIMAAPRVESLSLDTVRLPFPALLDAPGVYTGPSWKNPEESKGWPPENIDQQAVRVVQEKDGYGETTPGRGPHYFAYVPLNQDLRSLTLTNMYLSRWTVQRTGERLNVRFLTGVDRSLQVFNEDALLRGIETIPRNQTQDPRPLEYAMEQDVARFLREFLQWPSSLGLDVGHQRLESLTIEGEQMLRRPRVTALDQSYLARSALKPIGQPLVQFLRNRLPSEERLRAQGLLRPQENFDELLQGWGVSKEVVPAYTVMERVRESLEDDMNRRRVEALLKLARARKRWNDLGAKRGRQPPIDKAIAAYTLKEERNFYAPALASAELYRFRHTADALYPQILSDGVRFACPNLSELRLRTLPNLTGIEGQAMPRNLRVLEITGCPNLDVVDEDAFFLRPLIEDSPGVDLTSFLRDGVVLEGAFASQRFNSQLVTAYRQMFQLIEKAQAKRQVKQKRLERYKRNRAQVAAALAVEQAGVRKLKAKELVAAGNTLPLPFSQALGEKGLVGTWKEFARVDKRLGVLGLREFYVRVIHEALEDPNKMRLATPANVTATLPAAQLYAKVDMPFQLQVTEAASATTAAGNLGYFGWVRPARIFQSALGSVLCPESSLRVILGNLDNPSVATLRDYPAPPTRRGSGLYRAEGVFRASIFCGYFSDQTPNVLTTTLASMMHLLGAQCISAMMYRDVSITGVLIRGWELQADFEFPAGANLDYLLPLRARLWEIIINLRGRRIAKNPSMRLALDNDICMYWLARSSMCAFLDAYGDAIQEKDPDLVPLINSLLAWFKGLDAFIHQLTDGADLDLQSPATNQFRPAPQGNLDDDDVDVVVVPPSYQLILTTELPQNPAPSFFETALLGMDGRPVDSKRAAELLLSQFMRPTTLNYLARRANAFFNTLSFGLTNAAIESSVTATPSILRLLGVEADAGAAIRYEDTVERRRAPKERKLATGGGAEIEEEGAAADAETRRLLLEFRRAEDDEEEEEEDASGGPAQVSLTATPERSQRLLQEATNRYRADLRDAAPIDPRTTSQIDSVYSLMGAVEAEINVVPDTNYLYALLPGETYEERLESLQTRLGAIQDAVVAAQLNQDEVLDKLSLDIRDTVGRQYQAVVAAGLESIDEYATAIRYTDMQLEREQAGGSSEEPPPEGMTYAYQFEEDAPPEGGIGGAKRKAYAMDSESRIGCAVCRKPTTKECPSCHTPYCCTEHAEAHFNTHRLVIGCPDMGQAATMLAPINGVVVSVDHKAHTVHAKDMEGKTHAIPLPSECNFVHAYRNMQLYKGRTTLAVEWL
jgi:hypothetical protein